MCVQKGKKQESSIKDFLLFLPSLRIYFSNIVHILLLRQLVKI